MWIHWPALDWLGEVMWREPVQGALVLLLGLVAGISSRGSADATRHLPVRDPSALAAVVGGTAGYLLAERIWGVEIVSAALTALSAWGLLSLYHPERRRLTALLLVAALPLGAYLDAYAAFPLRLASAQAVARSLTAVGVASMSSATIIELDSGVAQVDAPCSGVRSLWMGALFYLVASWRAQVPLGVWWLLTGGALAAALVAVNAVRIALQVLIGVAAAQPAVAAALHVPLGIIGFTICGAAAVIALRGLGRRCESLTSPRPPSGPWVQPLLLGALVGAAFLHGPSIERTEPRWQLRLPPELNGRAIALSDDEMEFFRRRGPASARKYGIHTGAISGSMLAVYSRTWRAHHNPEHCLVADGHRLGRSRTIEAAPGMPVRMVAVGDDHTAFYWFQSPRRITDDIGARVWADVARGEDDWVLVSVLLEHSRQAAASDTIALLNWIRSSVAAGLHDRDRAAGLRAAVEIPLTDRGGSTL